MLSFLAVMILGYLWALVDSGLHGQWGWVVALVGIPVGGWLLFVAMDRYSAWFDRLPEKRGKP